MKKLLILPMLFACYMGISQAVNPASIIGKLIEIGNLLVAEHNFPKEMNWATAKKACTALGMGWRLPTKDELNFIYTNKDKIGGFEIKPYDSNYYWSSTEYDKDDAWYQDFEFGEQYFHIKFVDSIKNLDMYVRAVKSL
jgi:hypothetical protein